MAIRTFCSPKSKFVNPLEEYNTLIPKIILTRQHLRPTELIAETWDTEFFNKNNLLSRCLHSQIYQSDSLLALPIGTFSKEFVIFHTSHWQDIEIITLNVWPLLLSEYRLRPRFQCVWEDGVNWQHLSCLERAESIKWLQWSTWMACSKGFGLACQPLPSCLHPCCSWRYRCGCFADLTLAISETSKPPPPPFERGL